MIERGAEFILPGYEVMEELAARFAIPLVRKATPYGRRIPVGEETVSEAALEDAFAAIDARRAGRARRASPSGSTRSSSSRRLAALIKTRVAISNGHPAEDLAVSVLEEGASTFGDFENLTLRGRQHAASPTRSRPSSATRSSSPRRCGGCAGRRPACASRPTRPSSRSTRS